MKQFTYYVLKWLILLFLCICTGVDTPVTHEEEKDDILNLLKSQITDTAASRDKATKVCVY